ncbi:hypothetical protein BWR59_20115 [Pseudomonas sp. Bc-h]|nr:hypothetical protein BWR59_20115 [Pseudomonas sp. Bc-h]
MGPPPSAIHGGGRLSRHPCRSAHSTSPAFGLHPSRDLCRLNYRVRRSGSGSGSTASSLIVPTLRVECRPGRSASK